jgi:hypothetical protein
MSPDYPQRVANWLGEVFAGLPVDREALGGYRVSERWRQLGVSQ